MDLLTFSDIINIAIRMEQNSIEFYNKLSSRAVTEDARSMFKAFIGQEKEHLKVFKKAHELIASRQIVTIETFVEKSGSYKNILNHLRTENISKDVNNITQALEVAACFEKDSALFYNELRKSASGREVFDILETVIREEKDHFRMLTNLRKRINDNFNA